MNKEKNEKKLTRWLLLATIVLLTLVLGLQLWQIFGGKATGTAGDSRPLTQDAPGTENPQDAAVPALSPGKAAMVEDVRTLNGDLSAEELGKLSAEELEQLYEAGAPGLPIGTSAAILAAEEYAGTLEVDSVTSEADPKLDESPAHYDVELHHPAMGDFAYKVDAYSGEVLEGIPDMMQSQSATVPEAETKDPSAGSETRKPGTQAPAAGTQKPSSGSKTPAAQQPGTIGEEAAKTAAFTHAGVSAGETTSIRCKLDRDDGRQIYDVDFWVGNTEYEYEIDASSGTVLKSEQDVHNGTTAQQPGTIGEEAAKTAAFTHAGVSAGEATSIRCKLDRDDGRQIYDVDFWVGNTEYEYEIDASSGAVLKSGIDLHGGTAAQQPGSFIGEEAAKTAALSHAGVSAANASYIRWELDEDDGRWSYEIEFQVGNIEYEYKIDAASGAVLKAEQDT